MINFAKPPRPPKPKPAITLDQIDKKPLRKIIPAIVTPVTRDIINEIMMNRHAEWLKNSGIEEILVFGSTGEGMGCFLDDAKIVVDVMRRVGVEPILGIANPNPVRVRELIDYTQIEQIMVPPPMGIKAKDEEILRFYQQIDNDVRVMIYNNPVRFGINISNELFAQIFDTCPHVYAVKHCAPKDCPSWDFLNSIKCRNHKNKPDQDEYDFWEDILIYTGDDGNWPNDKSDGLVSMLANCFPKLAAYVGYEGLIFEDLLGGELKPTLDAWHKVCEILQIGSAPRNIKYILSEYDLCGEDMMLPIDPLTDEERAKLRTYLKSALDTF